MVTTKEKFQQIVRVMNTLNPSQFDIQVWHHSSNCGTVACIAGHCAMDPWFIDQGLTLVPVIQAGGMAPEYQGSWGLEALSRFLDIPMETSAWLFGPAGRPRETVEGATKRVLQVLESLP